VTFSPQRYRQIAVVALAALAVIIVTGAAVRLTGSGLGCDDWPNCSSERLIDVSSKHAAIEQINRLFTGVVAVAVIAAVLGAYRRRPRRADLVVLAWMLVVGVVANAVLGGVSVLVDLHPLAVQGHMLLSMALIVAGVALVRRAGEPDGVPRVTVVSLPTARLVRLQFAIACVAIFTGTLVTGSGPHAGDEDAERLSFDISAIARVHAVSVLTTIAITLLVVWRIRGIRRDRAVLTNPIASWMFVGVLQAALGYVQYFSDVPALLVGIHVAGATAVMMVTTVLLLDTSRPVADGGQDATSVVGDEVGSGRPI
jgi:cytochrome c oxidase assembly protein subunit 15